MTLRHSSMRRDSGTTLLELLIVMVIVSAALSIAAGVMIEAQERSVFEKSRLMDPAIPVGLQQLKADTLAATLIGCPRSLLEEFAACKPWPVNMTPAVFEVCNPSQDEPLKLHMPGTTTTIEYYLEGEDLWRSMVALEGDVEQEEKRIVAVGMKSFKCCFPPVGEILRVDLQYEMGRPGGARVVNGQRNWTPQRIEQRTLLLNSRGKGGTGW